MFFWTVMKHLIRQINVRGKHYKLNQYFITDVQFEDFVTQYKIFATFTSIRNLTFVLFAALDVNSFHENRVGVAGNEN
jgi:hypothetical protein